MSEDTYILEDMQRSRDLLKGTSKVKPTPYLQPDPRELAVETIMGDAATRSERYRSSWKDLVPFTDTSREELGDISSSLIRASQMERGAIQDPTIIGHRAEAIERGVGDLEWLGIKRGLRDVGVETANFFSGVANIVTDGRFAGWLSDKETGEENFRKIKKYRDSFLTREEIELADSGNPAALWDWNIQSAYFKATTKLFNESPEFPSAQEYVQQAIKEASNVDVSLREAEELTGFWRPESSLTEQVIRSIPEVLFMGRATVAFAARGAGKILKGGQKVYDQIRQAKGLKKQSITQMVDEDEFRLVLDRLTIEKFTKDPWPIPLASWLRSQRVRGYAVRTASVIGKSRQKTQLKNIQKEINVARNKKSAARTAKDKEAIAIENLKIKSLFNDGILTEPHLYRSIYFTEVGAAAGGLFAGNTFGQEWAWLGYLGGGLGSGISLEYLSKGGDAIAKALGLKLDLYADAIGELSEAQMDVLLKTGKLPKGVITKPEIKQGVEEFGLFLKMLPQDERTRALEQLEYYRGLREQLRAVDGMDHELLNATIGQAMDLIPLMILQEQLSRVVFSGAKKFTEMSDSISTVIKQDTLARKRLESFSSNFKELGKQADELGFKDKKFENFRISLAKLNTDMNHNLTLDEDHINELVSRAVIISQTTLGTSTIQDKEALERLVKEIVEHDLITRVPKDRTQPIVYKMATDIGDAVKKVLEGVDKKFTTGDNFWLDIAEIYDKKHIPQAKEVAQILIKDLIVEEQTARGVGRSLFEKLEALQDEGGNRLRVDVTKFMRSLYSDNEFVTPYDALITRERRTAVLQSLAKVKLSQKTALKSLTDIEGKDSIVDYLNPKINARAQEFKNHVLKEFTESGFSTPEEPITNVNYSNLKEYFELVFKKDLNNFDYFVLLEDYVKYFNKVRAQENLALLPVPKLELYVADIQRLSSGFSQEARNTTGAARWKYSNLAKNIVETIRKQKLLDKDGNDVSEMLIEAKNYWITNVVNRFDNPRGNPLGNMIHDTNVVHSKQRPNAEKNFEGVPNFITPPDRWVDIDDLITTGTVGNKINKAEDLVQQLKTTFGRYIPPGGGEVHLAPTLLDERLLEEGLYVLTTKQKNSIKPLLNALLKRHISRLKHVREAHADFSKKYDSESVRKYYKAGEGQAYREGQQIVLKKEQVTEKSLLDDEGLQVLEREGLLDLEPIVHHNTQIRTLLGTEAIEKEAIKRVKHMISTKEKHIGNHIKERVKFLTTINSLEGLERAPKLETKDAYDFFMEPMYGKQRINTIIQKLKGQGRYNEAEIKAHLSDMINLSLADKISISARQSVKKVDEGFIPFDADQLYTELVKNEDLLRYVSGNESYESARTLADFMKIMNRTSKEQAAEIRSRVSVPTGLSVESYISRVYSIWRGIISTKYVATEIALLAMRKRGAKVMAEILSDPEAIDAVIMLLERGGLAPDRVHGKVQAAVFMAFAQWEMDEKDKDMQYQISRLSRPVPFKLGN